MMSEQRVERLKQTKQQMGYTNNQKRCEICRHAMFGKSIIVCGYYNHEDNQFEVARSAVCDSGAA